MKTIIIGDKKYELTEDQYNIASTLATYCSWHNTARISKYQDGYRITSLYNNIVAAEVCCRMINICRDITDFIIKGNVSQFKNIRSSNFVLLQNNFNTCEC